MMKADVAARTIRAVWYDVAADTLNMRRDNLGKFIEVGYFEKRRLNLGKI